MATNLRHYDFNRFETHFNDAKTQLVSLSIPSDLNTPITGYLKLCKHDPYTFLFESVEGGETLGRYSIIGLNPDKIWRTDDLDDDARRDVIADLKHVLEQSHIDIVADDIPPMAVSGLFGMMGYDMIRHVEHLPNVNDDLIGIPDSVFMRPQVLCIFDHVKSLITLVSPVYSHAQNGAESPRDVFDAHVDIIENAAALLNGSLPDDALNYRSGMDALPDMTSHTAHDDYIQAVQRVKEYVFAGDVFQTVLSQRFSCEFDLPPFALYRSLRMLNPSPFLFLMNLDGFSLVGSSPEILVRARDNTVTIRPIAGTRPRGATPEQDNALAEDLLADEKECAEHLMLLDLGRNDIGRVSEFGSVEVTQQFTVEKYSHVMHIVSNVVGELRTDQTALDALFSGFPAGTVSGAPKIRAMEIIDELENIKRGFYAGGVGYLSANGDMDMCIALRTALVKDGTLFVQAGAGIVADSDPESEYQECLNKSQALFAAAGQAIDQSRQN